MHLLALPGKRVPYYFSLPPSQPAGYCFPPTLSCSLYFFYRVISVIQDTGYTQILL